MNTTIDTSGMESHEFYFRIESEANRTFFFTPQKYHDQMNRCYEGDFDISHLLPEEFSQVNRRGLVHYDGEENMERAERIIRMHGWVLHNFVGREMAGVLNHDSAYNPLTDTSLQPITAVDHGKAEEPFREAIQRANNEAQSVAGSSMLGGFKVNLDLD